MPVIYLTHPIHGAKVATMDLEAEFDEQHGWVRYTPEASPLLEEVTSDADSVPVVRRGRLRKVLAPQSDESE